MIRFSCKCGKPFEVKDDLVGKKIRCRFCSEISVIPLPSDARVSGHLEMLDWRTLGDMPVPDKVCLHCGMLINVNEHMCRSCGEVFGWAHTEAVPEVTMEVTDEAIDAEPEMPEFTRSGQYKHIEDVEDAPAQFEIVEIISKPEPVELELLKLPPAHEPVSFDVVGKQSKPARRAAEPPAKGGAKTGDASDAQKPSKEEEDTGTFRLEGIVEDDEKPKKTLSGRRKKSRRTKRSSGRRRRPSSRKSDGKGKPKR